MSQEKSFLWINAEVDHERKPRLALKLLNCLSVFQKYSLYVCMGVLQHRVQPLWVKLSFNCLSVTVFLEYSLNVCMGVHQHRVKLLGVTVL